MMQVSFGTSYKGVVVTMDQSNWNYGDGTDQRVQSYSDLCLNVYDALMFMMVMKFYPFDVFGARILYSINAGLPHVALRFPLSVSCYSVVLRAIFRHFRARRHCRFHSCCK